MTEAEKPKEKAPVDPALLPEEEREIFEQQLGIGAEPPLTNDDKSLIYGNIQRAEPPDVDLAEDNAVKWYRYFSGYDTYDLEMVDGKTVRYTHQYPTAMQVNELELLRAQVGSGMDEQERPLNLIRQHHLKELWYDKLAETYLLNTQTKQPMTHSERLACKDFWHSQTVLKSCLWRTNNDIGPRGKNFDLSRKRL